MKPFTMLSVMIGVLPLALLPTTPVWAQAQGDEARMATLSQNIDKETAAKGQNLQVQVLTKEFNVSPKVVEDLRAKQGWGGATIELAMAQHLTQTDPKTYPTITDGLTKIDSLRAEKMGWGKIAQDLGFKLGPVISAAEHTRQDLLRDVRAERLQKIEKVERVDRPDRPQRPERPERLDRPHR